MLRWKRPSQTTFSIQPEELAGCDGLAQSYTITVDATPNVADPADQTLCAGSQTAAVVFTGTTANTNYNCTNDTPSIGLAASGSGNINAFTSTNTSNIPVTANLTVTPQAYVTQGYVWGAVSENGTLILSAPAGKVFTTVAFASYGLPTGSNGNYAIGSCHATTSSTVMNAAIGQSGSFSVVANNATFGDPCVGPAKNLAVKLGYGISVNGPAQNFTITVNPTPSITAQTPTICSGTAFTVTPSDGSGNIVPANTTYTWTLAANANVSGKSDQTLAQSSISQTLTNLTNTVQTVVYTVTPVSATGPCTGSTFTVSVTVNPTPVVPAQTATICDGGTFTVTPTNNPTATIIPAGTTYSWSAPAAITGISGLASGTSASSISGTLTNSTNAPIDVVYTVTPTSGAAGNCVGASFTVTVTVYPTPALSSTLTPADICSGTIFSYSATSNTQLNPTFSWSRAAVAGISQASATGSSASISETLTNTTNVPVSVTYVYTITANGCSATNNVVVVVNPTPVLSSTLTPADICSASTFTYTATSSTVSSPTFAWTRAALTGITQTASSGSGNISEVLTNTSNAPISVTYVYTITANGCSATNNVVVVVNPTPALSSTLTPTAVCSSSNFTYIPTSNTVASSGSVVMTWSRALVAGISEAAATGTGNISEILTNTTNAPISVTYVYTITANGCSATNNVVVISNPTPVIAAKTQTICTGTAFTIAPSNDITVSPMEIVPTGTQYTWTVPSNIVGATSQSNAQANISQTLTNATSSPVVVVYTVTPTYTNAGVTCTGTPFTVTVTVNPTMSIANVNTTICTGSTFAITPVDGALTDVVPAGILYTWNIAANANIAGASNQTTPQVNISQTLANNAATTQQQIYTVTPEYTNAGLTCTGAPFTITVNVLSGVPSVNVGAYQTICSNGTASFTVSTVSAETGYWATTGNGAITPNVTNIPTITYNPAAGETGNVNIMYYATNACGTNNDVAVLTITALPSAGTISGTTSVCINSTTALSSSVTGGTWTTSNPLVANVN